MENTENKAVTTSPSLLGVSCVGVDRKQHLCLPDADTCLCGTKVLRKKLLKNDHLLFSCYECTY